VAAGRISGSGRRRRLPDVGRLRFGVVGEPVPGGPAWRRGSAGRFPALELGAFVTSRITGQRRAGTGALITRLTHRLQRW